MFRLSTKSHKYNILKSLSKGTKKALASVLLFVFFCGNPVLAITQQEAQNELNQINSEISNINATITGLKSQKSSLANELSTLDAQAQAIQLQIDSAQAQIDVLVPQIEETHLLIEKAETDLAKQKVILGEYVRQMYIDGQTSQVQLVLTSNSFSDFVDRSQYLNTMQERVKESTDKIIALKKELEAKRLDLETKKATADSLKASQVSQKQALQLQIDQKNNLIAQTNGNESAYQSLLKGKSSRKGILECIASGACGGAANGDLVVVNQPTYYSQQQDPWGSQKYAPCWDCTYANYGCLITSLAMYHGLTPPEEAARHSFTYDGYLIGSTGTTIGSGYNIDWGAVNQSLANGHPVIVEINYSHFILIVSTDGSKYFVNDPYFSTGKTYAKSSVDKAIIPY